jgi:hypothetical protein
MDISVIIPQQPINNITRLIGISLVSSSIPTMTHSSNKLCISFEGGLILSSV